MKLVVASGKGGVGKSMLASSLAILLSREFKVVACDCDVDAPNLGLWLGITKYDRISEVFTSEKAFIDQEKCKKCGKCVEVCKSDAIENFTVNRLLCEGCGACEIVCPFNAIEIKKVKNGEIRIKETEYGFPLISGLLHPGEAGSGRIVEEVRKEGEKFGYELMIIDAAAGTGCPVISSLKGCDFSLLVTEPTPSGLEDLKRILKLVEYFKMRYGVIINKWDINKKMSKRMENEFGEKILGKIPYDKKVFESIVNLKPVLFSGSKVVGEIEKICKKIKEEM